MSKVLFINGNLHGHINPTLPLVRELTQRGEEVYYFASKEFQSKLIEHGATYMELGDAFDQSLHKFRPHGDHPFFTLLEYILAYDSALLREVLPRIHSMEFDYIIHDAMFGAGNIIAKILNIPALSSCSSFVMEQPPLPPFMLEPGYHPQLDYIYQTLEQLKQEWDYPSLTLNQLFFKKEPFNLVYTSRHFHPQGESYDSTYHFIGPSMQDYAKESDFVLEKTSKKRLIYISLGTINNNCFEFYQQCFEAFASTDYQVVLSVGYKIDLSQINNIPDNFIVRNYVPQQEVLKQADLFISHGGLNSVNESLYYNVPIIVIPMANDQPAVAKRVTELGAGIELSMTSISPSLLNSTAEEILKEHSYYEGCSKIRDSFIAAGGCQRGADEIMRYMEQYQ